MKTLIWRHDDPGMDPHAAFLDLRGRMLGRQIVHKRLFLRTLQLYLEPEPGTELGLEVWCEPEWHLVGRDGVIAGSGTIAFDPESEDPDALQRLVSKAIRRRRESCGRKQGSCRRASNPPSQAPISSAKHNRGSTWESTFSSSPEPPWGRDLVILSAADWEREQETLYVLQIKSLMVQIERSLATHREGRGYRPTPDELDAIDRS